MCLEVTKSFLKYKAPDRKTVYKVYRFKEDEKGISLIPPYNYSDEEIKVGDLVYAYNYYYTNKCNRIFRRSSKRSFLRENKQIENYWDIKNGLVRMGAIHCFQTIEDAINSTLFKSQFRGPLAIVKASVSPEDWIADGTNISKPSRECCYLKVRILNLVCRNFIE